MDAREFLKLATELSQRARPADLRAAVGRAYYAVFNFAAEMLRGWNIPVTRNASAHGEIQRYLANSGDAELGHVQLELGRLRAQRNAADYDLTARHVEDRTIVQASVAKAAALISAMEQCVAPARSVKIIAAIQDYRKKIAPPGPGAP
jgi:uncharacterized protein (UPF0332 family)